MILFVFYAAAVWYGAVRWRRRWIGFAWVAAGNVGVLLAIHFHILLESWTPYTIYLPVLQTLLWSYLLLVGSIGLFVVCIPHRNMGPWCCQACGYDLTGVPGFASVCPECGKAFSAATARAAEQRSTSIIAPPTALDAIATHPPEPSAGHEVRDVATLLHQSSLTRRRLAAHHPPEAADQEDEHGHAQHQSPSQG